MEKEKHGETTVCVTGASGFIGSWLVKCLLQRGYHVRASVRDPGSIKKVKHLLELPNASTHLSLWRGELSEEGSYDDAIQGCVGVFHVATSVDFVPLHHPEDEYIKPTINGVLNVLRSCSKAKTVRRVIYTSTTGSVVVQPQTPLDQPYDESFWTDIDFCKAQQMMYFVAKTMSEKAAWEFAKENGLDLITIQHSIVIGPYVTPTIPTSIDISLALITRNEALYPMLTWARAVHVDDVCNAHIYLFEHSQAKRRYICSSHCFTIFHLAKSLSQKYPNYNIPIKFDGIDESVKAIPCSSNKLMDLGFRFKYNSDEFDVSDLCDEAIESTKEKGLIPLHTEIQAP